MPKPDKYGRNESYRSAATFSGIQGRKASNLAALLLYPRSSAVSTVHPAKRARARRQRVKPCRLRKLACRPSCPGRILAPGSKLIKTSQIGNNNLALRMPHT